MGKLLEFTVSKKDNILALFGLYKTVVNDHNDKGFDFLDVGHLFITAYNTNEFTRMSVKIGRDFELFFGGWYRHYHATEEGYKSLVNDINGILTNAYCVYVVHTEHKSAYELEEARIANSVKTSIQKIKKFKRLKPKNARFKKIFWDATRNINI